MRNAIGYLNKFIKDETGTETLEYIIILAAVIGLIKIVYDVAEKMKEKMNHVAEDI